MIDIEQMKKERTQILAVSLPAPLCRTVRARAVEKHGKRGVSTYVRKALENEVKKK